FGKLASFWIPLSSDLRNWPPNRSVCDSKGMLRLASKPVLLNLRLSTYSPDLGQFSCVLSSRYSEIRDSPKLQRPVWVIPYDVRRCCSLNQSRSGGTDSPGVDSVVRRCVETSSTTS